MNDTIFALATSHGRAGVSVIRISGLFALEAAEAMVGKLPSHGRALRNITNSEGDVLDQGLILTFDDGKSFTGEPVVELQTHGSIAVVSALLRDLGGRSGLRMAEPGEFTRRALENGRLDLAQVEGLADLIDAETESQRKQALRVFSGQLGALADSWRTRLLRAMALVEATIDFSDEDVPVDVLPEVKALIEQVQREIQKQIDGVTAAERIRSGFEVAIVGPPNAGKSTLLNRLAGRDAAITSEYAGTTRDVIEVHMDLGGYPVTVLDTAGIRESEDAIEKIGISRALERAKQADIRVHLLGESAKSEITPSEEDIIVWGKSDTNQRAGLAVSGLTGEGLGALINLLTCRFETMASNAGIAMRERHRVALVEAMLRLGQATEMIAVNGDLPDLVAEELRHASVAIGGLVGRIGVEEILGEIFASFCIGK